MLHFFLLLFYLLSGLYSLCVLLVAHTRACIPRFYACYCPSLQSSYMLNVLNYQPAEGLRETELTKVDCWNVQHVDEHEVPDLILLHYELYFIYGNYCFNEEFLVSMSRQLALIKIWMLLFLFFSCTFLPLFPITSVLNCSDHVLTFHGCVIWPYTTSCLLGP